MDGPIHRRTLPSTFRLRYGCWSREKSPYPHRSPIFISRPSCDRGSRWIFRMVHSLRLGPFGQRVPGWENSFNRALLRGSLVDSKVAAILRGKTVMRARPETVLQPGDRLLMIASQQAQEALLRHLAPPSVSAAQATALAAS